MHKSNPHPQTTFLEKAPRLAVVEFMEVLIYLFQPAIAVYGMAISVFVLTGHIPPTTHLSLFPVLVLCANFPTTMLVLTVMQ